MRMKTTIYVFRVAARWIQKLLTVRLPMDAVSGLRTR
jgi:hypothetical protein